MRGEIPGFMLVADLVCICAEQGFHGRRIDVFETKRSGEVWHVGNPLAEQDVGTCDGDLGSCLEPTKGAWVAQPCSKRPSSRGGRLTVSSQGHRRDAIGSQAVVANSALWTGRHPSQNQTLASVCVLLP